MTRDILFIVGAYLLGAVPFGYLIGRAKGVDIRTKGSHNIGATNVGRVMGGKWGLLCFLLDVLKGFAPTFVVRLLMPDSPDGTAAVGVPLVVVLTGLATIVGHNWPVFLKFKGGKGVATSCGVFLALFWPGVLIALGVWLLVVALTRYVSLGSILGGLALLGATMLLQEEPFGAGRYLTGFVALGAVLSIIRHRANIGRLLTGTENKVGGGKKEADGGG